VASLPARPAARRLFAVSLLEGGSASEEGAAFQDVAPAVKRIPAAPIGEEALPRTLDLLQDAAPAVGEILRHM